MAPTWQKLIPAAEFAIQKTKSIFCYVKRKEKTYLIATIMPVTMIVRRIWTKMKLTVKPTGVEILNEFLQFARYPV